MDPDLTLKPELLALIEKANVKKVQIDQSETRFKRICWTIDYPVLSYFNSNTKAITMAHLADPDAEKRTIVLEENEKFLAFVDKFPSHSYASISFLLKKDQVTMLRTYNYSKPFEKKNFDDDTEGTWT